MSSNVQKARARGRQAEYVWAKKVGGVRTGLSKFVKLHPYPDHHDERDCKIVDLEGKKPDVVTTQFAYEIKNVKDFSAQVEKDMRQAVNNCPSWATPKLVYMKQGLVVMRVSDYLDFYGG